MRKAELVWLTGLLVALLLAGCSPEAAKGSLADTGRFEPSAPSSSAVAALAAASSASGALSSAAEASREVPAAFDLEQVAPYSGNASVEINGNVPLFTTDDFARGPFEEYSPLDVLGRCGAAFALVGPETMPDEPRGSIGMVKPSGWHTVRYDGLVDGNYLYNRCHLIGYQLTGENANERNLITGTRTMNVVGMLPFEDRVAAYVGRTGNHVLYRSTPAFQGEELVARGVLLEAESVEDAGAGVRFCAWCYNVEPGVEIDYATGESRLIGEAKTSTGASGEAADAAAAASAAAPPEARSTEVADVRTYVLNTRSRKFHHPECPSVDEMAEHNKKIIESTRDQIIDDGYDPCKRCNP